MKRAVNLAIVSTNKDKYSETFIHNHIQRIPANIHFLFDGYLPKQYSTDKGFTSRRIEDTRKSFFWKFFPKQDHTEEKDQKALEKYLQKNNIDALLCEYGPSGVEMMALAKKLAIPLTVYFHGYDAYRDDILNSYGEKYPELFETATAIIAVSQHMKEQLQKLGCTESKLHVMPCGVDTNVFNTNQNLKKNITFVSCGRFVEKKAPTVTIRAFAKVLSKLPGATLVMIGEGELLEYSKVLTSKLGLRHAVEFRGVLNQNEVAAVFNEALVFVQHSITTPKNDMEGTPLTLLESGACGLPAVSTKHGGIVDAVIENETGFLVDENDVDGMAQKMLRLATEPGLALNMGSKARERIRAHYNMDSHIETLWRLIKGSAGNNF